MQYYLHIIFLVTIAFLPHTGIGSILYKKNIVSGCIISILLLASIVSPIAYMNAMFIKPIIFIYSFIGLSGLFFFYSLSKRISLNAIGLIIAVNIAFDAFVSSVISPLIIVIYLYEIYKKS